MDLFGWIQLALYIILLLLLTKPVGLYLVRVLDAEGKTFLDPGLKPVERLLYRIFVLDPKKEQEWKQYTVSMLLFSLVGLLFTYAVLRLHHRIPFDVLDLLTIRILLHHLDGCGLDQFSLLIGFEILKRPLRDQKDGVDETDREEQVEVHAD